MTYLHKPVRRETPASYQGRNIVIQLEPSGIVRLKEKGRRLWYMTTISRIYQLAAETYANKQRRCRKCLNKMICPERKNPDPCKDFIGKNITVKRKKGDN